MDGRLAAFRFIVDFYDKYDHLVEDGRKWLFVSCILLSKPTLFLFLFLYLFVHPSLMDS